MSLSTEITSAAIATLIAGSVSTLVAMGIAKSNNTKRLEDSFDSILKIAVQYPFLENNNFTSLWDSKVDQTKEENLRYDVYCTLVFNFLERLCKHYSFNETKINDFVNMKDWIRTHENYWKYPLVKHENLDSYNQEFRALVEKYIGK